MRLGERLDLAFLYDFSGLSGKLHSSEVPFYATNSEMNHFVG